jgi:hypothetical protein
MTNPQHREWPVLQPECGEAAAEARDKPNRQNMAIAIVLTIAISSRDTAQYAETPPLEFDHYEKYDLSLLGTYKSVEPVPSGVCCVSLRLVRLCLHSPFAVRRPSNPIVEFSRSVVERHHARRARGSRVRAPAVDEEPLLDDAAARAEEAVEVERRVQRRQVAHEHLGVRELGALRPSERDLRGRSTLSSSLSLSSTPTRARPRDL